MPEEYCIRINRPRGLAYEGVEVGVTPILDERSQLLYVEVEFHTDLRQLRLQDLGKVKNRSNGRKRYDMQLDSIFVSRLREESASFVGIVLEAVQAIRWNSPTGERRTNRPADYTIAEED